MGTWRIPLLHWSLATGDTVWAFDEGGGIVLPLGTPQSGTLSGQFPASNVGIYLDGSLTPTDMSALPAGFTPESAYTFHWRTTCGEANDTIAMSFTAIADVLNHNGPDVSPQDIASALTGLTLVTLQGIPGSTVTATMNAPNASSGIVAVGDETDPGPNPDTLIWFDGDYDIVAPPVVTQIRIEPMPIRTPMLQGGGRRGR